MRSKVLAFFAVVLGLPWVAGATFHQDAGGAELPGFQVLTKGTNGWEVRGTLHYDLSYRNETLDLSRFLPDADGEYQVRISHADVGMANVDDVTIQSGSQTLSPERATDFQGTNEIFAKLSKRDFDVINVQGKTVELRFPALRGTQALLNMTGREEDPSFIPGGPCSYPSPSSTPKLSSGAYHYTIGANRGALTIDGRLDADETGRPLFKTWTQPVSGHPDGFTYGYLRNDDRYLYGAIDYTSDNTYDGLDDFGAVLVKTDEGWKKFQVSVGRERWGLHGFTYTDKVAYEHKVYEFKIPFEAIGSSLKSGKKLDVAFLAYGTSACPADVDLGLGPETPAVTTTFLGDSATEITMLQITDFAAEANALVDTVTITGDGTGQEAADIQEVRIYKEIMPPVHDGVINGTDALIGTGTFSTDDGTALVDLDTGSFNARGVEDALLVTYVMKPTAAAGSTYRARIASNTDLTTQSNNLAQNGCAASSISYVGAPINGNVITVQYGSVAAASGANNPDGGFGSPGLSDVPMLQFSLAASATENQTLTNVRVTGGGTGDDSGQVTGVHLWRDADDSGTVSPGDTELASAQTFSGDDGTATFAFSPGPPLGAGITKNYLVTYDFAAALALLPWKDRFAANFHWNPQLLFPWTYPLSLSGCGGSGTGAGGGGGGSGISLAGAPAGTQFTDTNGNAISSAAPGSTVELRTTDGALILQFTAGTENVDLTGATAGRDTDETLLNLGAPVAALVVNGTKSAVSGLPETLTVFVPCDSDDNRVRVCPGGTALTSAFTACAGSVLLGDPASGLTWANQDRAGTDDCRVTGAASAFENFLGQGVTVTTFQASLASSSDVTLTGASSGRTIHPTGLPVSGGEKTIVGP